MWFLQVYPSKCACLLSHVAVVGCSGLLLCFGFLVDALFLPSFRSVVCQLLAEFSCCERARFQLSCEKFCSSAVRRRQVFPSLPSLRYVGMFSLEKMPPLNCRDDHVFLVYRSTKHRVPSRARTSTHLTYVRSSTADSWSLGMSKKIGCVLCTLFGGFRMMICLRFGFSRSWSAAGDCRDGCWELFHATIDHPDVMQLSDARHSDARYLNFRRRRVLELGAGMGVAGLMAHKTGASVVVMTDGDSSVMKYLNEVGPHIRGSIRCALVFGQPLRVFCGSWLEQSKSMGGGHEWVFSSFIVMWILPCEDQAPRSPLVDMNPDGGVTTGERRVQIG